ncbi:MAG: T9SS type A sorting domain-containing protein, partial [Segetibacter sp.]
SVRSPFGPIHDQIRIVRFNIDGSIDFTYTSPSPGTYYNFPVKLVKQDSNIVISGYSVSVANGTNMDFIYTLNSSSNVIHPYYISPMRQNSSSGRLGLGLNATSLSKTIAIQGDQMIVAGLEIIEGQNFPYALTSGYYVSKYVNGLSDRTFGASGTLPATLPAKYYENMLLSPGGKFIVVNAAANKNTGNSDFYISRFNENGSPDLTFNGNGTLMTDFGSNDSAYLSIFQDDKLIVAGVTQNKVTGDKQFAFARYNDNGTLDNSFDEDGKQTLGKEGSSYNLEQVKIEADRLLVSGNVTSNVGETFKTVAAYLLKANIAITCPSGKAVSTDKGICSALVTNIDPIITPLGSNALISYTMSGSTTLNGTGSVSGKTFNKGETAVTYQLSNEPLKTCSFTIRVEDKEAPVITGVSASPNSILYANHQMKDVEINYNITDNCSSVNPALTVSSNEPQSGTDKFDIANDWKVIDAHHVQLRAERAEKGNGRVYTIAISGTDAAGNKSEQQVKVSVPKNNSEAKNNVVSLIVKLMSNPSKDFFTLSIQSNITEPVSLRVMDIFGRVVETRSGIPTNGVLTIGSSYRSGTYFAEVKQGDKKETLTMLKN